MSKSSELVVKGTLTDLERDEISRLFENDELEIDSYNVKSHGVKELIELIFNDFDTIVFVRDLILDKAFEKACVVLMLAFQYFTKKGKKVENLSVERAFLTVDGKRFTIQIIANPEQFKNFAIYINSIPKDELIPKGDDSIVTVFIDQKGRITINVM
jgi:hypothetical protein